MNKRTVLVWFRNDLRVRDNEMLSRACERSEKIIPVFCFDPRYYNLTKFGTRKTGLLRTRFIFESVKQLQDFFKSKNGNLIIKFGLPEEVIPLLATKYKVDEVYHHREVAHEETVISDLVEDSLWRMKINLRHFIGHTLFHKEDFPFPVKDIPDSFDVFQKKLERETSIRECFETPLTMAFPEDLEDTKLPALEQLGFDHVEINKYKPSSFIGGEHEANRRLSTLVDGKLSEGEFVISPWLSTGSLSVHSVYFSITKSNLPKNVKERIIQGLWWKDYFRFMFKKHGNIFFLEKGYTGKPPVLGDNQDLSFQKWKEGNTLDPNINMIMQRLNETGYIDFKSREKSASYLIDILKVNWLLGAAYFEEKLLDYAPSSNYGNWAHMAGVGSSSNHNRSTLEKTL
jgi:deoxyribodipyrimidine photo-lyase